MLGRALEKIELVAEVAEYLLSVACWGVVKLQHYVNWLP